MKQEDMLRIDKRRIEQEYDWVSACDTPNRELCHDLENGVHGALIGLAKLVPELSVDLPRFCVHWLDDRGRCRMLGLTWEGADVSTCYRVGFGLQTCGTWAGAAVRSQVTVQRMANEPYAKPTTASPLDVTLNGPSCRDGRLLTVMMVDAVRRHARETCRG